MHYHFLNAGPPTFSKCAADARELKAIASTFLSASCDLKEPWVKLFLIYHAIECALKAYLASHNDLEDLKHDHRIIELARRATEQHDLKLSDEENSSLQAFNALSRDGQKNRPSIAFRYYMGGVQTKSPDVLKPIAESIIRQIAF